jgi:hypothetical protein
MTSRNQTGNARKALGVLARAIEPRRLMAPRPVKALPQASLEPAEHAPQDYFQLWLFRPDYHTHSLGFGIDE